VNVEEPEATQVVCANVIADARGVLTVRESKPSALGRLSLPGGRLETGETLAQGAAREAFEETGLTVEVVRMLGIYHCPATLEGGSAVIFVFESRVVGGQPTTSAEHPEVIFVPRQDLTELIASGQVRGSHVPLALAALDADVQLPNDLVTVVAAADPPRDADR